MKISDLGRIIPTEEVLNTLSVDDIVTVVYRHYRGDCKRIFRGDYIFHKVALEKGLEIVTTQEIEGRKICIITKADRSCTTVMFAEKC